MTSRIPAAVLSATLVLVACDDAATAPEADQRLNDDVAEYVADAAIEDLAVMTEAVPGIPLRTAYGPFGDGAGLGTRSGMERSRQVTFLDVDGNEQDAYDAETTASIHIVSDLEGQMTRGALTASVERHRDMWVTGLAGEETERTWNGNGSSEVSRTRVTDEYGTRSYEMESTADIDGVVRAVDRVAQPWPLSGTITRHVEVTIVNGPNGDESRERTVVLTFDGTQYATLEIDGETYEVDLAARQADRASRRHGQP